MAHVQAEWPALIPPDQWSVYQRVIDTARARGVRFSVGGAFAVATHTGRWRNTKDLDLYIFPQDRELMVEVLRNAGLVDYYETLPYDRRWIYRTHENGTIVDIIWAMANRRAYVDEYWIAHGPEVTISGERLRVVPAEEMIWNKLFVLQRDRCDWPDCLNLLYATGPRLDWRRLLARMAEDVALLRGAISVFTWLCPGRARELPVWLWSELRLPAPPENGAPEVDAQHVELLDSRPWFAI